VHDGIAMVELLVGLPGMRVLGVVEGDDELVVTVETTATVAWCPSCGVRAQAQDRTLRSVRDLPCFGRPARLEVSQRRWRCCEALCPMRTWTESIDALGATAVMTRRAGAEACRQGGEHARPVAQVAREFAVCWWTVMNAVVEPGTPLVDDPGRVGSVSSCLCKGLGGLVRGRG
jgi:transposase